MNEDLAIIGCIGDGTMLHYKSPYTGEEYPLAVTHYCPQNAYFGGKVNSHDGRLYFDGLAPRNFSSESASLFDVSAVIIVGDFVAVRSLEVEGRHQRQPAHIICVFLRGEPGTGAVVSFVTAGTHVRRQQSLRLLAVSQISYSGIEPTSSDVTNAKLAWKVFNSATGRPSAVARQEVLRQRSAIEASKNEEKKRPRDQKLVAKRQPSRRPGSL